MNLKFRCPSCAKLYQVQSEEIQSAKPVFKCLSCEKHFSFDYPPVDFSEVTCSLLSEAPAAQQQAEALAQSEPMGQEMRPCPKCGALNGRRAKECYSCSVLFERLEGLPKDLTLNAQPSLVRKWRTLLEDFENLDLHKDFIESCQRLDALRFAVSKYNELKTAEGGDALCEQMLARINALSFVQLSQKSTNEESPSNKSVRSKRSKYIFWTPFVVSGLLILRGVLHLGHRNLIGVGVALACMTVGLIVMVRGRLSLSDFLD